VHQRMLHFGLCFFLRRGERETKRNTDRNSALLFQAYCLDPITQTGPAIQFQLPVNHKLYSPCLRLSRKVLGPATLKIKNRNTLSSSTPAPPPARP
jgi:hypothetical protein